MYAGGGRFTNFTTRPVTIRGIDVDLNTEALGNGDTVTWQMTIVHSDGADTPTLTRFRTTTQQTSVPGFRTFEFTPSNPILIQSNESISLTLTNATNNQVTLSLIHI